ncbi:MAG: archaeosortase/exosortase family protein, partial [Bdellovibrionales bacterium]|nr:archaeosortase/exosortase family protein [Bdellovibrionales bacterium]
MLNVLSVRTVLLFQMVAFWPVWRWYWLRIWDGSDEPWGIVALFTAIIFFSTRSERILLRPEQMRWIVAAEALYVVSFSVLSPLPRALLATTCISLTVAPMIVQGGRVHLGSFGLLVLSLPVIASLQFYVGYPLRLATAFVSAHIVSLTGFPTHAFGTSLFWAGEVIAVDAPCAGIRMLWCSLYLAFTVASFKDFDNRACWMLYLFSSGVVFCGNIFRNVLLFYIESGIVDAPAGAHSAMGLLMFAPMALLILGSKRLAYQMFSLRRSIRRN